MCGICGILVNESSTISKNLLKSRVSKLLQLSESRGKEAAGIAVLYKDTVDVFKSPHSVSQMFKSHEFRTFQRSFYNKVYASDNKTIINSTAIIWHSRLVTNGSQVYSYNNQPVITDNVIGLHNGIIVNYDDIWKEYKQIKKEYDVDSEVIFRLIGKFYKDYHSLRKAIKITYEIIEGMASIAALFINLNILVLATNNGSLYYFIDNKNKIFYFASEKYILAKFIQIQYHKKEKSEFQLIHLQAGQCCIIDISNLFISQFLLSGNSDQDKNYCPPDITRKIREVSKDNITFLNFDKNVTFNTNPNIEIDNLLHRLKSEFPYETSWQDSLQRCTKCILPETMPFIKFDNQGVCNYCRNYNKIQYYGEEELHEIVKKFRHKSDKIDCVVGVSGGRDSLYSLHYIKNILEMNPVAYTYDWGMVTDLARRNISRICAKLGIEHILVSADIVKKRNIIRKNITAWLKKPDLGLIPLFMAGDKQYYYYLYQVQKQVGCDLTFLGENMLERTDFKTGFAGIAPFNDDPSHVYTLPLFSKIKLAAYYAKNYILNKNYLNESIIDTLGAFISYYIMNRNYINLYNYIPWKEEFVVPTLLQEYNFEKAPDSENTWRIGDGTAAFYNYIYYNTAGFTENDTFRSNQIREGMITREQALSSVINENRPRYESIIWYLNIINIDIDIFDVFKIINNIQRPKNVNNYSS